MVTYYGVRIGCCPGVYTNMKVAMRHIIHHPSAQFKSCNTYEEADDYVKCGPRCRYCCVAVFDPNDGESVVHTCDDGHVFQIYTDGACRRNGAAKPIAGIGVHFPTRPECDFSELLPGRQTNNRAEIQAAIRALETAHDLCKYRVEIFSDSKLVVNGMNKWIHDWRQKNWIKPNGEPVVNKDDFQELEDACALMKSIVWTKVPAHSKIPGNVMADWLANKAIDDQLKGY